MAEKMKQTAVGTWIQVVVAIITLITMGFVIPTYNKVAKLDNRLVVLETKYDINSPNHEKRITVNTGNIQNLTKEVATIQQKTEALCEKFETISKGVGDD